jgi:hypothetical protein
MLERLLPRRVDAAERGSRAALAVLALLAALKIAMGLNSIFTGRRVATSADGIPLDAFPPDAARAVVAIFATWGLGQVVLGLFAVVVLARYRALAPLAFLLLLVENVGRKAILHFSPNSDAPTTANVVVNAAFVVLMLVGLALALRAPRTTPEVAP